MIIYLIFRLSDGKAYVGKTCGSLERRIDQHYRNDRTGIGAAMRAEGKDKFAWCELASPKSIYELNSLERRWITILKALEPYGFNRKEGGDGHRAHGRRLSKRFHKRPKRELPEYFIDEPDLEKARQDFADQMSII